MWTKRVTPGGMSLSPYPGSRAKRVSGATAYTSFTEFPLPVCGYEGVVTKVRDLATRVQNRCRRSVMARPRVFISSTYFDLQSLREELDRFLHTLGYEPVRHELGHVAYGREDRPEAYAYREAENCDMLVSIIGGHFGTNATGSEYSISQEELKRAHARGKQVYVFVDHSVHSSYFFYLDNKENAGVKYKAVNDVRIFKFLEEVYSLNKGNPVFPFRTGGDIVTILREQWAHLFQRLLSEEAARPQQALLDKLQTGIQTLDEMVKFLQEEKSKGQQALQDIVLSHHPIFAALRAATKNQYRLYFTTLSELEEWLLNARSFVRVTEDVPQGAYQWMRVWETVVGMKAKQLREYQTLTIARSLFDERERLRPMAQAEWKEGLLKLNRSETKPANFPEDDDIPF